MSCKKCTQGQSEPALLEIVRNKKNCSLPEYCTMRECINEKAGIDATIPAEYWDMLNDILQRLAALENGTGQTVTIPGGRYFLCGCGWPDLKSGGGETKAVIGVCVPFSGVAKSFVITTAPHNIIAYDIYKGKQKLTSSGNTNVASPTASYTQDVSCSKGDILIAEVQVSVESLLPPGDNNRAIEVRNNFEHLTPLEQEITSAQIEMFKQQGVWRAGDIAPRIGEGSWDNGLTKVVGFTVVFDGNEQTISTKGQSNITIGVPDF